MPLMNANQILNELAGLGSQANVDGMARFGIVTKKVFGVPTPTLRAMGRRIGKSHKLALELWKTGVLEARFLASLVDVPAEVSPRQMEQWTADFDNWATCDSTCGNLFDKTPYAFDKAMECSGRHEEFVKRAGFVMMACLAVHDKKARDAQFLPFLKVIRRESTDDRNFVRKAVNWALRQIGKSRPGLYEQAIETARGIRQINSRSARWIAADALRELTARKKVKQG